MRRPARQVSQRGLLLLEAVLSAVVITTGLIFISRGLGGQLRAIRSVEEYDTLLSLARGKLAEFEAMRLSDRPLPPTRQGVFTEPFQEYQWEVSGRLREDETLTDLSGTPLAYEGVLTVSRFRPPSSAVRLPVIWPSDWIPETWR